MPTGLQLKVGGEFTDTTRPLILPTLGATVPADRRWVSRAIPVNEADLATSWVDSLAGSSLIGNGTDTNPDSVPGRLIKANGLAAMRIDGYRTVTFTASTDTVTWNSAHNRVAGDAVQFSEVTSVGGVSAKTTYYVKTAPTTTTMTLAATRGGATLDITADGTGNANVGMSIGASFDATKHRTVALLFRRQGGNGFIWSGGASLLGVSGNSITLTKGASLDTGGSIYSNWHIIIVRLNAASTDYFYDGTKSAAGGDASAITQPTKYGLGPEGSTTVTFTATDYVEMASWSSILSDADCAAVRASWKATYESYITIP